MSMYWGARYRTTFEVLDFKGRIFEELDNNVLDFEILDFWSNMYLENDPADGSPLAII